MAKTEKFNDLLCIDNFKFLIRIKKNNFSTNGQHISSCHRNIVQIK